MTQSWTDRHLDDLSRSVDHGFAQVDDKLERAQEQSNERFERVDERFEQVDKRLEQIDERFDQMDDRFGSLQKEMTLRFQGMEREAAAHHLALMKEITARSEAIQHSVVYALVGVFGAFMAGFAGILVVIATQL